MFYSNKIGTMFDIKNVELRIFRFIWHEMHWMHREAQKHRSTHVSNLLARPSGRRVILYTVYIYVYMVWMERAESELVCTVLSANPASMLVLVVWRYYIFGSPPLFMVAFDSISHQTTHIQRGIQANARFPCWLTNRFGILNGNNFLNWSRKKVSSLNMFDCTFLFAQI